MTTTTTTTNAAVRAPCGKTFRTAHTPSRIARCVLPFGHDSYCYEGVGAASCPDCEGCGGAHEPLCAGVTGRGTR